MLKKLFYCYFLCVNISYGQILNEKYISYSEENIEYHSLQFSKDSIQINIPQRGSLFPEMNYYFPYTKSRDTIKIEKIKVNSNERVSVTTNLNKKISKGNILIHSKNEIRLISNDQQPYFIKKHIDSLTGGKPIIALDNKVYRYSDSLKLQKVIEKFLSEKKNEKYKVSILRGKKAYEKYGKLGIYNVIEFIPKKTTTNIGYTKVG